MFFNYTHCSALDHNFCESNAQILSTDQNSMRVYCKSEHKNDVTVLRLTPEFDRGITIVVWKRSGTFKTHG
jgi:hypothetical protein